MASKIVFMRLPLFYLLYLLLALIFPVFFVSNTTETPLGVTIGASLIYIALLCGWPLALYFFLMQNIKSELFNTKGISIAFFSVLAMNIFVPIIGGSRALGDTAAPYIDAAIILLYFYIFFETARLVSYFENNNLQNTKATITNFFLLLFLPLGLPFLQAKVQHLKPDSV